MGKKLKLARALGLIAAAISLAGAPAVAAEPRVKHTLGSGPNIYRVEIRNLNWFEVHEAGDSDGVGELHELTVQLRSYNPRSNHQYDGEKFTGTELYLINQGGIVGGRRNFPIRVGQHVFTAADRRPNDTTQMWVHIYSNPEDTEYISQPYSPSGLVELTVSAVELDCAGQRVCNRVSKGGVTIKFKVPEFSRRPSNRCGPDNTFRLEPLDGELQISGLSDTSVFSYGNSRSLFLGINYEKGGPRLQPFNADICIASTVKPSAIPAVPDNAKELIGNRRRLLD